MPVDLESIKESVSPIGNIVSNIIGTILKFIGNLAVNLTELQSKVVSLLILSFFLLVIIKFINFAQKPLKWIISILLIVLILSIIFSF